VTRLYLVRHGRAAAGYDADEDPGLDEVGRGQAEAMADALNPIGPLPVVVSPLRRTRETAAALERAWGVMAAVDPAVGEIPSPVADLSARGVWLRSVLESTWSDLHEDQQSWRERVQGRLLSFATDTVVVTHFVAINVAVGMANGDDRVVCCMPDNCSITIVDVDGDALGLVELGVQAQTVVR
jgi:broad specificity phosphatase PhoE